ncbi:MAG: hypothetical protein RBR07_01865 [Arcobacteraceae bacterium]|nr:hypothetical protein [Arcobacteraceae bacterium]
MLLKEQYSPMYFLAALGAGGLSVSFYMYLMFLVPHEDAPMATYNHIMPVLSEGTFISFISAFSLVFIVAFAFLHFKLLIWNVKQYKAFKATTGFEKLMNSNAEVTLLALPLTFAMTINVFFVLGATFIPNLWTIIEYMFPFALLGFGIVGYYALKIFLEYFSRLISGGEFDCDTNNNLSQMISIFAFSMIGVGFAAPGAMSHYISINAIGIFGAILFTSVAFLLLLLKFVIGFRNMIKDGIGVEASPSLWIMIPILTLIGITLIRIQFGLEHNFDKVADKSSLFTLTSVVLSLQLIFGALGFMVMKKIGYFEEFIHSNEKKSPVSFALICPGVAFFVFGMFFINLGLVFNGILDKYSVAYYLLMIPFVWIQVKTIVYFFKLKSKFDL